MSLMDGLKENLRNPLVENEADFKFAMECDFEAILESAVEKHLSQADIDAILRGDDDIPEDEDPDEDNIADEQYICTPSASSIATEGVKGIILRHRAHKLDKAKVTVLADELSQPGNAEKAIRRFIKAASNMLTQDSTAEAWVRASYDEYRKDDNASQKTTLKKIDGYLVVYVTLDDQLQMVEFPTMTKKSKASTMVMLPSQMAQIILKPVESSEIADTAASESAGSEDDLDQLLAALEAISGTCEGCSDPAKEAELIAACDAAFEECSKTEATEGCGKKKATEGCGSCKGKCEEGPGSTDIDHDDDDDDDDLDIGDDDDDNDPFGDDAFESMLSQCLGNL